MSKLKLIRVEENPYHGTFGVLLLDDEVFCVTLEPPDKQNQKRISNIPPGEYICKPVKSPKFGNTWEVTGVPERSHILFHAGNTKEHTLGCILLGETFGKLKSDQRGILNSGVTFRRFLYTLYMTNLSSIPLTICEV